MLKMTKYLLFKALGDKTRFLIIEKLLEDKKNCCTDLADITNRDLSTISRQLEILKKANIIKITKIKKNKCISLTNKTAIKKIIKDINKIKER